MQASLDRVAAVILAAGASTRFGSPKQLARIGKRTMLETVADVAHEAGLSPVIAVVPPGIAVPPDVVPDVNGDAAAGMSLSLRMGLAAVPPDVGAAVILLGDQPTLDPAVVGRLLRARGEAVVVATTADGVSMPPVLLERAAFRLADALVGDEGLRSLLRKNSIRVATVSVPEQTPDVDTPDDLAHLGALPTPTDLPGG